MDVFAFLFAVLALLLAPGPTNTLIGLAGAQGGRAHAARLIPAELCGYLAMILPLALLGAGMVAQWPRATALLKGAAALWVLVLAIRLWRAPGKAGGGEMVSARRVYLTTMLNPKALIFGLVLLPAPGDAAFLPRLGLFALLVALVALLWGLAGSLTRRGADSQRHLALIQRAASLWLAIVSVTLASGAFR